MKQSRRPHASNSDKHIVANWLRRQRKSPRLLESHHFASCRDHPAVAEKTTSGIASTLPSAVMSFPVQPLVIIIQQRYPFTPGFTCSDISCFATADVLGQCDDPDARISQLFEGRNCGRIGSINHDYHFEIGIGLVERAPHGAADEVGAVARGHNGADQRQHSISSQVALPVQVERSRASARSTHYLLVSSPETFGQGASHRPSDELGSVTRRDHHTHQRLFVHGSPWPYLSRTTLLRIANSHFQFVIRGLR